MQVDSPIRKLLLYPSELRGRTLVCLSLHAAAFPRTKHGFSSKSKSAAQVYSSLTGIRPTGCAPLFPQHETSSPRKYDVMLSLRSIWRAAGNCSHNHGKRTPPNALPQFAVWA
jgi:hypothetical protein